MNESIFRPVPIESASGDPKGLALLIALAATEIWSTATSAQAYGFFSAVGRRLAEAQPMEDASDLTLLGARANRLWAALDWGHVTLSMEEEGIAIRHQGLPPALDGDMDGLWPEIISAVLEGAYDSWFRTLGSGAVLTTRRVDFNGGTLDLWHGR